MSMESGCHFGGLKKRLVDFGLILKSEKVESPDRSK